MRTEHVNFAESTTVIKPLTEEEKREKLAELKQRLAEKRAAKAQADIEDQKTAEKIRRKAGQDMSVVKAQLEEKEMKKDIARRKKEKDEELAAKRRIKEQIEADRQARLQKKQEAASAAAAAAATPAATLVASTSAPAAARVYTEARLQIRQPDSPQMLTHSTFSFSSPFAFVWQLQMCVSSPIQLYPFFLCRIAFQATDTLSAVYEFVRGHRQGEFSLMTTFPRRVYGEADMGKTLTELQLVPSAALSITK